MIHETVQGTGLFGASTAGAPPALAALLIALLAVFIALARRRGWYRSFRRATFFFLLYALADLVAGLIPPGLAARGASLRTIFVQIVAWLGVIECLQGLVFDLVLSAWLKRPPVPRILRDFLTILLALAALFFILRGTLGVNLTSLVATSAMISVILGLALQDTLGSFFAGLALQMEAPLEIGDWVQIDQHLGKVQQNSWRSVRLLTKDGDEITLPNSAVARAILQNISKPSPAHRCFLEVRVPYRHPPNLVLDALAAAAADVTGVLADPPPNPVVWECGDAALHYRIRFWIEDFQQSDPIISEVATRVWYRFRREGIAFALPIRVLQPSAPETTRGAEETEIAAALRSVDLFCPLAEGDLAILAAHLRPLWFGRGEQIIRQGDRGDSLFLLQRGRVEVRVARGEEAGVVNTLGPGGFFGEMSLLAGGPRTATVVALEDTEVLPVTAEAFRKVVAANPAVLEGVTRVVSGRRSHLEDTIRETEDAAAEHAAAHGDLMTRVRAFFSLPHPGSPP